VRHHTRPDGSVTPEFAELLVKLAAGWPYFKLTELTIRVYARVLDDMPLADVRRACGRALSTGGEFFPAAPQLRRALEASPDDAALLAWTTLTQAASGAGAYMSITVEDAAAADALVQVFGSWPAFCAAEDGPALAMRRQEFLAAYRDATRRLAPGGPWRPLAGLCELAGPNVPGATWRALVGRQGLQLQRMKEVAGATSAEARALPQGQSPQEADGAAGGADGAAEGGRA
jgi:hypothetical protein